jgi:hypothetical protein
MQMWQIVQWLKQVPESTTHPKASHEGGETDGRKSLPSVLILAIDLLQSLFKKWGIAVEELMWS